MAGDWLKMRHDLADDPAVIRMAAGCGIDEDAVVGKLHRLWSWADRHTTDGRADGVGLAWVDRTARHQGFAAEMVRVGWLEETGQGLNFPRFDRHCSDSAKARALTKNRVEKHRNGASVTDSLPEKRREEYPPPPPRACAGEGQSMASWATLRDAWKAGPGSPWTPQEPPEEALERLAEDGWLDAALTAIGRLAGCHYFRTPVGLPQFCGPRFVRRVNEGRYDTRPADKAAARGSDDRPPPRVDPAFDKARAATLAREEARRRAEHDRLDKRAVKGGRSDDTDAAKAAVLAKLQEAMP